MTCRLPGASCRYTTEQATRWLAFLAAELDSERRQDLAVGGNWTGAVRWWRPIAFAIRATLVCGVALALALAAAASARLAVRQPFSCLSDLQELLLGGPVGRRIAPSGRLPHQSRSPGPRPAGPGPGPALTAIVTRSPWHLAAVPSQRWSAWIALIAIGVGFHLRGIRAATASGSTAGNPELREFARYPYRRVFIGSSRCGPSFLLVVVVLALEFAARPITPGLAGFFHMPSARLLLVLCMLWMLVRALTPVRESLDEHEFVSPAGVLRLDRRASVLPMIARRACGIVLAWLCFGPYAAVAYGLYAVVRLLCQVLLGSVHTASGRFADTRFWLAWRRRMPLRPMAFLADAHRHGVLRQTGAAYQFEHGLLQQQLSVQHPRLPAGPASPTRAVIRRLHGLPASPDPLQPPISHAAGTEPIWAEHFGKVAARLSSALGVGAPLGGVMRVGPGCVQHFTNTAGQHPWVMCGLPGGEPVLVAWAVWAAARRAGAGAAGNAHAAVGYPVACAPHEAAGPRVIPADAECVEMAGGSWGQGATDPRQSTRPMALGTSRSF